MSPFGCQIHTVISIENPPSLLHALFHHNFFAECPFLIIFIVKTIKSGEVISFLPEVFFPGPRLLSIFFSFPNGFQQFSRLCLSLFCLLLSRHFFFTMTHSHNIFLSQRPLLCSVWIIGFSCELKSNLIHFILAVSIKLSLQMH